jgi:5-methylcytosine-specific restriction endonuclease McrA
MRKLTRKGIVRKLDKLVSQIVIARDGKCIVCGTTQNLTCGHLFSRVAYSTRWDLDNCYAQCLSCNLRHEYDPYPMTQAVILKLFNGGTTTLDILHYKYVTVHKFKTYELEELYEELKQLK